MTENTTPAPLTSLAEAGVSVWLDDLNRPMIKEGELAELVRSHGVVGVTTNPTIFAAALKEGDAYTDQVRELAAAGTKLEDAVHTITTTDVRDACDVLRPVYDATDGRDGRVSLEVPPGLARDTDATVAMAQQLWDTVDRPNLFIKIPATVEGLPAISRTLAAGISVNVTLIFSLDRYRGVMNAFLTGLEQARLAGHDLSGIESVASFFVSRVDAEIDTQLDSLDGAAADLKGRAGVANARLAHATYLEVIATPRWQNLASDGAHPQRPLWASTGVKNPDYPDTLYVEQLVVADTVNTMPRATLDAVADHGPVPAADTVTGRADEAQAVLDELERVGVSYTQVVETLEEEGLQKFDASWAELLASVREELEAGGTTGSGSGQESA